MDNLKLDGDLLKPIADLLEEKIGSVMEIVLLEDKPAEITLKLTLGTIEREDKQGNDWKEPVINYNLSHKFKESKHTEKGSTGIGTKICKDAILDEIIIEKVE